MSVVVLVGVVVLLTIFTTVFSFNLQSDADDFLAGQMSQDDFESAVAPLATVSFLSLAVTLAAGIVTIIWMYRISSNVRAFGRQTTFHPLFAIFGWVLPPWVNIVPFLMARELWKASEPGVVTDDEWKRSGDNPVLWVWIVAYGPVIAVLTIAELVNSGNLSEGGGTEAFAESLQDYGALGVLATVLTVIGGVAWIMFARQLTQRHISLTREG